MESSTLRPIPSASHLHAVRFFDDSTGLCRIVAQFLLEGLVLNRPVLLIATPPHVAGVEALMTARGLDVAHAKGTGHLWVADAADMLSEFMVDGVPAPALFQRVMTARLEAASGGRRTRAVRAYGEMVDVLWRSGQPVAAARLETLWNALASTHLFELLCGYSRDNSYGQGAVTDICGYHTHVVSAEGGMTALH